MKISIVSLFPEFFNSVFTVSLLGKAISSGIIDISYYNPREYACGKRRNVDDAPYGGGVGMVLSLPPLDACLSDVKNKGRILVLSASGKRFTQKYAEELAKEEALTIVCGRYEGIDGRLADIYDIEEISIGDFILNGGESGAVVLLESIGRLLPSFMGKIESGLTESFTERLLEYPQYTRPSEYKGVQVPSILLSGHHGEAEEYRRKEQIKKTLLHRPDILQDAILTKKEREYIQSIQYTRVNRNIYVGLIHYPVLSKEKKSIAVSLTNLDIHDIARCTCTYGLGGYYITTPIAEQQNICHTIIEHWKYGRGSKQNQARSQAMERVFVLDRIEDVVQNIADSVGSPPYVIATSATASPSLSYCDVRDIAKEQAILLLFGTSHGLAPEVYELVNGILPPIRYIGGYNHLSVRSAVAITIDRILGDYY